MDTIWSVSEYLECLSKIKMEPKTTFSVGCFTLFRGQANANWLLSPSLYRQNLFEAENLLLTEIKHICPNEFGDNRFDSLVKMQHFGMPTRLLDVTTNPLVSLYFACESSEQSNEDGIVYIFPNMPVSWSNDLLVDLVMDFVYDYFPRKMWLDQMLDQSRKKYGNGSYRLMPDTIDSLLHYLTIPAFAVMPAKTNERIEAQDGAFFVFGMHFSNREVSTNPGTIGRVYYNFEPIEIDNVQQIWKKTETLRIPAAAKKGILNQLDILGINERKLFPDLSHQINHTVRTVKAHMIK
jgi:hypothetical protein